MTKRISTKGASAKGASGKPCKLSASALDILKQMSRTGGYVVQYRGLQSDQCLVWFLEEHPHRVCLHPDHRKFRRSTMDWLALRGFIVSATFGHKIGTMYRRWRITKLGLDTVSKRVGGGETA